MSYDGQDRGKRFKQIAMTVRNRDAGRCRGCGKPEGDENISVHHLTPDAEISDVFDAHLPVNLVTLCRSCHSMMESESLLVQLRKIGIEDQANLMLSDREREGLNGRLEAIGPEILNVKLVSKKESEEFLNRIKGNQAKLSDF